MEVVATEIERGARRAEPYLDLRVLAREFAEPRQQPALQEFVRHAEIEQAADAFAADPFDGAGQFVEAAAHARQQLRTLLRQRDGARMAPEQGHPDVRLERLDLRADGSGRHAEFLGGGGEAQVRGDGLEDAQGVERDATRGWGGHRRPRVK